MFFSKNCIILCVWRIFEFDKIANCKPRIRSKPYNVSSFDEPVTHCKHTDNIESSTRSDDLEGSTFTWKIDKSTVADRK